MNTTSRRCSSCILPETPSLVSLDDSGRCDLCHTYDQRFGSVSTETLRARDSQFGEILEAARRKTDSYDCLVPVSGGKDSMYALYACAGKYGMNVLAYNFDNGFQSEKATENIKRAVRLLGVDLVQVKPSERTLFDLYKTFLMRTGDFCAPCNRIIWERGRSIAAEYRIPIIVTGNSRAWQTALPGMSISKYNNNPYFWRVLDGHMAGRSVENLVRKRYTLDLFMRAAGATARNVNIFEYVNPKKEGVEETLASELGWEPPSEELEHGDCLLNPVKDYVVCKRWGFSEVTGGYAAQVRNGRMSRTEALAAAEKDEPREEPEMLEMFLRTIGLARADFEEAIGQRHFTDFSNEFGAVYRIAKRVKRLLR